MKRFILLFIGIGLACISMWAQKADMDARKLQMALYAVKNLYVDPTDESKLVGCDYGYAGEIRPAFYLYRSGRNQGNDRTFGGKLRWYRHSV